MSSSVSYHQQGVSLEDYVLIDNRLNEEEVNAYLPLTVLENGSWW